MSRSMQQMAALLDKLEQMVRGASSPGLGNSSIEGGAIRGYAPVTAAGEPGALTTQTGRQFDNTYMAASLGGPNPPRPSAPIATSIPGGLMVEWDGTWDNEALIPLDFSRMEVHALPIPDDPLFVLDITFDSLRVTIETPRGARVAVGGLPPKPHYVWLVARTLSGKFSDASQEVTETPRVLDVLNPDTGDTIAGLDTGGVMALEGLSVNTDPIIMGEALLGDIITPGPAGMPGGVFGARYTNSLQTDTEIGLFEITCSAKTGRMYLLQSTSMRVRNEVAGGVSVVRIRFTLDGSAPSVTSPIFIEAVALDSAGLGCSVTLSKLWKPGVDVDTGRFLLTVAKSTGGSAWIFGNDSGYPIEMFITDLGVAEENNATTSTGGGQVGGVDPPPVVPPPPVAKRKFVSTYNATWSRWFEGNGSIHTGTTEIAQGYYDITGDSRSMIGWGDIESVLVGADVLKVELFLYAVHWYWNDGGTAIIGTHGQASPTGVFVGNRDLRRVPGWGRATGKWVDITSFMAGGLKSGAAKGIVLGPALTSDQIFYGRFTGVGGGANLPKLRVTYNK